MGNMSYCRFTNTLQDLLDCKGSMDDGEILESKREQTAKNGLIRACVEIAEDHGIDIGCVVDVTE